MTALPQTVLRRASDVKGSTVVADFLSRTRPAPSGMLVLGTSLLRMLRALASPDDVDELRSSVRRVLAHRQRDGADLEQVLREQATLHACVLDGGASPTTTASFDDARAVQLAFARLTALTLEEWPSTSDEPSREVARLVHDLRNPLAALQLAMALVRENGALDERLSAAVDKSIRLLQQRLETAATAARARTANGPPAPNARPAPNGPVATHGAATSTAAPREKVDVLLD